MAENDKNLLSLAEHVLKMLLINFLCVLYFLVDVLCN